MEPDTGLDKKMDKTVKRMYKGRVHLKKNDNSVIVQKSFQTHVFIFSVEHQ